jgi:folate-binding protein YgfZ
MSEPMNPSIREGAAPNAGSASTAASEPRDGLAAEVAALESGLGLLDQSAGGVILARGPQTAAFLNGIVTSDVNGLALGAVQSSLICGNKGKILFEVLILRAKPEDYLVLTGAGELEGVAGHLNFYHVREDLELGQLPFVRQDLIGPGAGPALESVGLSGSEPSGRYRGAPVVTATAPLADLPRVIVLAPAVAAADLSEAILGGPHGGRRIGLEAFDEARVWRGFPRAGVDFTTDFLPAEAALYTHLSFTKGCYVGQEIHARMHYRGHPNRKLVAADWPPGEPADVQSGAELFHGAESVGRLTSVARLPREGRRRGIALVRFALTQPPTPLSFRADGAATVSLSPLATDLGSRRP